ncbi:hypothetical protein [Streptomyces olivaceoviridis]|uniref:hypothetical protein n=1 Tax=Streptomyces olivaceoviridis TaxID=1921 RepID=UPI0036F95E1C
MLSEHQTQPLPPRSNRSKPHKPRREHRPRRRQMQRRHLLPRQTELGPHRRGLTLHTAHFPLPHALSRPLDDHRLTSTAA